MGISYDIFVRVSLLNVKVYIFKNIYDFVFVECLKKYKLVWFFLNKEIFI